MAAAPAAPARAELDASAYEAKTERTLPAAERARREAEFAAERARAEAREREERERLERERRAAAIPNRPYAERLLHERCTSCHGSDAWSARARTRLGWWWVVVRMQYLNGARIAPGERSAIVDELARISAASRWLEAVQWLALGAAAAVLAALPFRRRRRRRDRAYRA